MENYELQLIHIIYEMKEREDLRAAIELSLQENELRRREAELEVDSVRCVEASGECSICISEIAVGEDMSILDCNHGFHTSCISEWGRYKLSCPICRKGIKGRVEAAPIHPVEGHVARPGYFGLLFDFINQFE